MYEGGIRIPQLIKVPGGNKNIKINEPTVSYDLFPTILDFVGIENNLKIDGISLMPTLMGKDKISREEIFWHFPHYHGSLWKPGAAIIQGDWKLLEHFESNSLELFNLSEDISEMNDLSLIYPDKTQYLLNRLHILQKETSANMVSINENFNK